MYQKYYTDALVLGSREHGESDRIYALYTEGFGLVRAKAAAVRKESSRMRYALQHYAYARVALVYGKHGWRLGGSVFLRGTEGSVEGVSAFARIARLVLRLVAGEESNPYLFAVLREAHGALTSGQRLCGAVELVCVARILHALGYLSFEALSTTLFTHTMYAEEDLREAEIMREKLLASINRAIADTHL